MKRRTTPLLQLRFLILTASVFAISACQSPASRSEASTAEAEQAIRAMGDNYAAAINAGDRDKWLSFFADSLVIMPPGQTTMRGRESARAFAGPLFDQFVMRETIVYDEIHVDGDWASGRFHYTLEITPKKGGTTITESGKAVAWLKRSGNAWVFTHWIWNQDPARK